MHRKKLFPIVCAKQVITKVCVIHVQFTRDAGVVYILKLHYVNTLCPGKYSHVGSNFTWDILHHFLV